MASISAAKNAEKIAAKKAKAGKSAAQLKKEEREKKLAAKQCEGQDPLPDLEKRFAKLVKNGLDLKEMKKKCKVKPGTARAKRCSNCKKEIRKHQLEVNNESWDKRVEAGTAGHHKKYRGKDTKVVKALKAAKVPEEKILKVVTQGGKGEKAALPKTLQTVVEKMLPELEKKPAAKAAAKKTAAKKAEPKKPTAKENHTRSLKRRATMEANAKAAAEAKDANAKGFEKLSAQAKEKPKRKGPKSAEWRERLPKKEAKPDGKPAAENGMTVDLAKVTSTGTPRQRKPKTKKPVNAELPLNKAESLVGGAAVDVPLNIKPTSDGALAEGNA